MTIDEAIQIKEAYLWGDEPDAPLYLIRADKLSIEALYRIKEARAIYTTAPIRLLPGEDPE